jgi:hypothetical protein
MICRVLFHLPRMKLLPPYKTLRTSVGQTRHSILAEVLLCIGSAMVLVVGCQPKDTCYRCCFDLTDRICFVEVVVASAAAMEAPAMRAHVPTDKSVLSLAAALPELLFLI